MRANENQYLIGQYNEETEGYTRTISALNGDNELVKKPLEGVVFAIGNGRLNAFEVDGKFYSGTNPLTDEIPAEFINSEDLITRSNAMVVSADGTVSANNFAAPITTKLGKLLAFLADDTNHDTGDLHWNESSQTWSFVQ